VKPVRPGPAVALAALLCASAVIGLAACGGDDQGTTAPQPAKTTTITSTESTSTTSTTTEDNGGVEAGDGGGGQGNGGNSASGGGTGSGGSGPEDTPSHDVTPPANTPQGKFEQFCNQNPGACG
jgi:hypothetical protein